MSQIQKRPTWVTVIGILGIIFGGFSILGGLSLTITPSMLKTQKEMVGDMQDEFERMKKEQADKNRPAPPLPSKQIFKPVERLFDYPPWYGTWCVIAGILSVLIAGFYLLASIQLLQVKPWAVTLFYWASGMSIGFSMIKLIVTLSAASFLLWGTILGHAVGMIAYGVLLIIVVTSDKDAFSAPVLEVVEVADTGPADPNTGDGTADTT